MTKKDLMKRLEELKQKKQMNVEGIGWNSRKDQIQNAIECLECPDDMMDKYFTVVSLKWSNICREIEKLGDWKHHQYFRLYVYNHARMILA